MATNGRSVIESCVELARGKPAAQSSISQWSIGQTPAHDAAFVNDGQIDRPDRDFGNHTAEEAYPWWQVDLGAAYALDRIVLFNRRAFGDRLGRFSILISHDGVHWQTVYRHQGAVVGDGDAGFAIQIDTDHLARWVRVRLDQFGTLHLRAVEVYGHELSGDEHVRGRAAAERAAAAAASARDRFVAGRNGRSIWAGGFEIFADVDRYSGGVIRDLENGGYEAQERSAIQAAAQPGDRVLEIGTAVGVVCMTAASIVGPENVATFDANPHILEDARRNFAVNGMAAIKAANAVLRPRSHWRGPDETASFGVSREFVASRLGASANDDDIVEMLEIPTLCLENEIEAHRANVLVCDIEGGEVDLLITADLSPIKAILIETHYWAVGRAGIAKLLRKLAADGFDVDLDHSAGHVSLLRKDMH